MFNLGVSMLFLVLACFFLNIVLSVHTVDNKVIFL